MSRHLCALLVAAAVAAHAHAQDKAPPLPQTPRQAVTDVFHGAAVTEEYRWLENWDDPAVRAWSEAQNARARWVLDHYPAVDAIRERITQIRSFDAPTYFSLNFTAHGAPRYFALKNQPPRQQPMLVVMPSPDQPDQERIILDPGVLDPAGLTSIDFYVPSLDGRLVAVSLSHAGSESGDVRIFETDTGKPLPDVIPRVNGGTAGGSVAWNHDATGFFYTRYPRAGERAPEDMDFFQQVYFHRLGQPTESDTYEIGKDFPRIAEIELVTHRDSGRYTLATVANGDGGEFAHYLRGPEGHWTQITRFSDKCGHANLDGPDYVYLESKKRSPLGQLIYITMSEPVITNEELVLDAADDGAVLESWARSSDSLFALYQKGGVSDLRLFDGRGTPQGIVPIPPISSVEQLVRTDPGRILFLCQSYTLPPAWYAASGQDPTPRRTALARKAGVDFADVEVVREMATSRDGTKVPVTIMRPKGAKLDGSNPTLLYGYGGYSINLTPAYSEVRKVWLEQGGIWAVANIRGGGEFGEEWHTAGNLLNKQNVFDDFYAAIRHLQQAGYCTPEKTAIMGGSNGGLLMGAMITQHPESFRACVSAVGIYDMLRVELSPNGAFNVTEFGTVKDKAQFQAMHAYSPYHRVQDGRQYPAILFMTGANDPRVDPMQSRKMTARLQATGSRAPVLLRTSANSGHGGGSSLAQRIEEDVDRFAFLFGELGVTYKPVK
jgi:prolyl oligopeptidase